ncbi:hypothetical protein PM082_019092 [Marasmius tenuissimus]|nr:hypothetical protein PM082_019092 [Marasmius tenuissimus]
MKRGRGRLQQASYPETPHPSIFPTYRKPNEQSFHVTVSYIRSFARPVMCDFEFILAQEQNAKTLIISALFVGGRSFNIASKTRLEVDFDNSRPLAFNMPVKGVTGVESWGNGEPASRANRHLLPETSAVWPLVPHTIFFGDAVRPRDPGGFREQVQFRSLKSSLQLALHSYQEISFRAVCPTGGSSQVQNHSTDAHSLLWPMMNGETSLGADERLPNGCGLGRFLYSDVVGPCRLSSGRSAASPGCKHRDRSQLTLVSDRTVPLEPVWATAAYLSSSDHWRTAVISLRRMGSSTQQRHQRFSLGF